MRERAEVQRGVAYAGRVVRRFAGEVLAKHARDGAVMNTWGQHVDNQVLDVTKASHCTGSVSSALASGDAGERTQVQTVENKEEFTAAPTRTYHSIGGRVRSVLFWHTCVCSCNRRFTSITSVARGCPLTAISAHAQAYTLPRVFPGVVEFDFPPVG